MKRLMTIISMACLCLVFTACNKDIEIFEKPAITEAQYLTDSDIRVDTYYVKDGTRFAEVYKPLGNVTGTAKYVKGSRVFYMYDDQPFIPEHYKNEIIAYASASASLESVTLERFKDMGWSFGIYGGHMEDDGYYHLNSKDTICEGSEAADLFNKVYSSEIRIVSVGNVSVENLVDPDSGIITGLNKGETYLVEFFSGTYFYRVYFKADTQFLQSFELYSFGKERISDTRNGYMCFETPNDLKSGYYYINGSGLFLYHEYTRDELMEDESLNESNFNSVIESIASYSQEFVVSVPYDTKNVCIMANTIDLDSQANGKVAAPDGTIYNMDINEKENTMTLSLSVAKAGEWKVYIPQYITVTKVNVTNEGVVEDTVVKSAHFSYAEGTAYQRFYVPVYGNGNVYATLIREGDAKTYLLMEDSEKTPLGSQRYLYINIPYVEPGEYELKVYFYQSTTEIGEITASDYVDSDSDIYYFSDEPTTGE